jgi:hypothetical protein
MRDRGRAVALVTMLAALALAAGGCGGGDDESSGSATTTAVTETTEPPTTAETTTGETTEAGTGAGALADEDCAELANVGAKFSEALAATGQGTDYEATTAFFRELVDKAPDEIKNDLATLATAWAEIAAALKDVDLSSGQAPSAATIAKLQELSTKFNTPALQQASTNLAEWTQEHCGTTTP